MKMQKIKTLGFASLLILPNMVFGQGIYTSQNQNRPMKAIEHNAKQDSLKNIQVASTTTAPKANPFPTSSSQINDNKVENTNSKKEAESKEVVLAMNNNVTTKVIKTNTPVAKTTTTPAATEKESSIKGPL